MFEQRSVMFLYCVSPVHVGSGTAIGAIDNPIQRERHTNWPMIQGSGIKGALRHHAEQAPNNVLRDFVERIFGPESAASEHAGAISFGDGQLLLFPVRCLKQSFVYTTCPTALRRFERTWKLLKGEDLRWNLPGLEGQKCAVADERVKTENGVILEVFQADPLPGTMPAAKAVAEWLAENALAPSASQFEEKLKKDLVILSDEVFGHFVEHATVVEPHVAINDVTGTVDEGKLFYTENVPPEALFYSVAMASPERKKKGAKGDTLAAQIVMEKVKTVFDDAFVQLGGDATTGRGQVVLRFY
jgi:CRISPR-associated protein Cmr4